MSSNEYTKDRQEVVAHAKEIAEAHWAWVSKTMGMMYKDAMVHGYVHGHEDGRNSTR